jgi:hypothetical protein
MKLKAKDLAVGMNVVVHECGERYVYKLTHVQPYPSLGKHSEAFIAVATEEWIHGVPRLNGTLDPDEEVEIEE